MRAQPTNPSDVQELQPIFTNHQWRYLEALKAQAEAGVVLTQKETAKRARVSEFSVVVWNRSPKFRRAVAQILDEMNEPLTPLVLRALAYKAIQGSPKHAALYLKGVGRLSDRYSDDLPGQSTAPAVASVTFVGLPVPPTPADRARLTPPQGANVVFRDGKLVDPRT